MSNIDPFEAFKNRREIELLEGRFKKQAEDQQKRVDDALSEGDEEAATGDRVTLEMEDFFKQSTDTVEKVLEKITGTVEDDDIEAALEQAAAETPDCEPDELDQPGEPAGLAESDELDQPDEPEAVISASAPSPAVNQKLDLRAALARIRQYQVVPPAANDEQETSPVVAESEAVVEPDFAPDLEKDSPPPPMVLHQFEESRGDHDSPIIPSEGPVGTDVSIEVTESGAQEDAPAFDEPGVSSGPLIDEPAPDPEPVASEGELASPEPEPAASIELPGELEIEPEPALETAPEPPPTLEELAEEVRRLKAAMQALVQKGILTPEDLEA